MSHTQDWLLRVGDGVNFWNSSKYFTWGVKSWISPVKSFIKNVKPGDRLWFISSKSHGKIIAVSTYRSHNGREIGPLVDVTKTNGELGWVRGDGEWDTEIHYTNLYNLDKCSLLTHIKGAATVRILNEKCPLKLPIEYSYIERYSKAELVEV